MKFFKKGNTVVPQNDKKILTNSKTIGTNQNFMSLSQMSSIMQTSQKKPPTIASIKRKHMLQILLKRFKYLIPPSQVPQGVNQNWQQIQEVSPNDDRKFTRKSFENQLNYQFGGWKILQTVEAIAITILFWMISVQLFFLNKFQEMYSGTFFSILIKCILFAIILTNIIVRELLIRTLKLEKQEQLLQDIRKDEQNQSYVKLDEDQWYSYNILNDFLKPNAYGIACGLYLPIQLLGYSPFRYLLQALITIILLEKVWNLSQNIESITNWFDRRGMKNQLRLIMLFMLVLGVSHILALILYCLTYVYPQENWLTAINKSVQFADWYVDYVYSLYFAITTMVTVGYGDITPKQYLQLIFVSLIQLIGTAFFGYMINVIGVLVVQINKKREQFDNYMSTINKLQQHYQISSELVQKFKSDIKNYESIMSVTPLSEGQQAKLFQCIQPAVKQSFILQTNIRVIKKSMFFLTHFTVNFQNQIALKLIRKIYNKGEKIKLIDQDNNSTNDNDKQVEQGEKERYMAIINSGSVDIQIINQHNNANIRKFVKNINPIEGKPTLNVFGYSAMILNKNIDLEATTQDISAVYLLRRKDLLECMEKNMLDFEGVAELREKMLQHRNINEIQANNLIQIEKHFIPNTMILSKKARNTNQKRGQATRRNRKSKMKLITMKNYQNRTMICIDLEEEHNQCLEDSRSINTTSMKVMKNREDIKEDEDGSFTNSFDQYKNFENFMKKFNISRIITQYDKYVRKNRKQRREKTQVNRERRVFEGKKKMSYSQGMKLIGGHLSQAIIKSLTEKQ